MLTAQAHSFTQQARLAVTLAWVAGYTNVITIVTCAHGTSHVSGTASNLGRDAVLGEWGLVVFAGFLLVTFFLGAVLSGVLTEVGRRRTWESIYVLPMAVETVLLGVFAVGIEIYDPTTLNTGPETRWLLGIASAAMGLQNATITKISAGVVRTTHMTGIVTDLGIEVVQFGYWILDRQREYPPMPTRKGTPDSGRDRSPLRQMLRSATTHPSSRRLALLGGILLLFTVGAGLGTILHEWIPRLVMFPPVFFLIWIIYQDITRPIAEIEESELVRTELGLPEQLAVFHLRRDRDRRGRVQRLPNLMLWLERLPSTTRVVILDLTDVSELDSNAAFEVRALLKRFAAEERHLILAGVTPAQYEQLRAGGAGDLLDESNACPDLELAVARGINVAMG